MATQKLSYQDLVEAVYKYRLRTRWEVVTYCMGFQGELTQENYDAITMLYENAHINE